MVNPFVNWFVHQINVVVCHKRMYLLEKKPGAISGFTTKIIFLHMLRRIGSFKENSKMDLFTSLKPKVNDSLNDAVVKIGQYILTVNACNEYEHFTHKGRLSNMGKNVFWHEVDDLLQRFDLNKVKLLPNLKNPPRAAQIGMHYSHTSRSTTSFRSTGRDD